jgi:type I restriction enzyme M protein
MLVEEAELKAVVTMPGDVFKPYAGVATAILLFTKAGETNHTWFYNMESDGYSLDDKRNKIEKTDIHDIIQKYRSRDPKAEQDFSSKSFFIEKDQIIEAKYDLSFNKYFEEQYEEVTYDPPKVIIARLQDIEQDITAELESLNELLK